MAGLSEDSTDIFLSQISMLTDWDVVVVARMFQKIGWSERWCTRIVHADRTLGRIPRRCPAVKAVGEKRADGLRSSWMDR